MCIGVCANQHGWRSDAILAFVVCYMSWLTAPRSASVCKMGLHGSNDLRNSRRLHAIVHEGIVQRLRPVPYLQSAGTVC
jgi:hypothetical protein